MRLLCLVLFAAIILPVPGAHAQTQGGVAQAVAQPDITTRELLAIINERDQRYTQRWDGQERAIAKAESASEKRFDSVNEFRGQLKDQAATFAPRAEMEIRFKTVEQRISVLENQRAQDTARTEGVSWVWTLLTALSGALGALLVGGVAVAGFVVRQKAKQVAA